MSNRKRVAPSTRVVAGALGTTLEWFDFTLYVYLAPVIAEEFFPSDDKLAGLLATFGVFAAGYLMRPLGAAFFGHYGDTRGRKAALFLSVVLMSAPMLAIAFLPNYDAIGVLAPIILVVLRLIQGFSVGGEFSGSIVLLQESAGPEHRGFVSNLAQVTAGAGFLLSSLTATILHAALSDTQMQEWGWRLPFVLGAGIGVLAIFIRRNMSETPEFEAAREAGETGDPGRELWHKERSALVTVTLLMGYLGLAYYLVATFVPTFLSQTAGAKPEEGLLAATFAALLYTVLTPFAGSLSDRVGRKPPMLVAAIVFALVAYPVFLWFDGATLPAILIGQTVLMGLVIVFTGASTPAISELFSTETRYSGVALGYNIGLTAFGATAPLVATALIQVTGWDEAAAMYLVVASLLVIPLLLRMPETLRRGRPPE